MQRERHVFFPETHEAMVSDLPLLPVRLESHFTPLSFSSLIGERVTVPASQG